MKFNHELLKKLTEADAISGNEFEVRDIFRSELSEFELDSDNLGSQISKLGTTGPKIMLAGHMDEVGFMVKRIDENGFVFFETVGGWWNQVMLAQRVIITTNKGVKIEGIIGCKPPHVLTAEARKNPVEINTMFIDLGVKNKQEALDLGIQLGNQITPKSNYQVMNNPEFVSAKALDDRVGVYIVIEVMKKLREKTLNSQVYGCGTTQEEVGLRGARTCSYKVNPDISIAIDTGLNGDTPSMTSVESENKLGEGPLICVMDAASISNVSLRNHMFELAEELGIKYQADFLAVGGTDAGAMHVAHDGSPSLTISVSTRYLHSHVSVVSIKDINDLIDLLVEFISRLDQDLYESLI